MDAAVVCLINEQRTGRGLPALAVSRSLGRAARSWTRKMVRTRVYTDGDVGQFTARISRAGYRWAMAGEDIDTGVATPRAVVAAWMASPPHCRIILNPGFRSLGAAELPVPIGGWARGPATWTVDFGLAVGQSPASSDDGPMNSC